MKKQIKQAISFLMAICLLAGNSYVNVGTSAVMITDLVEVAEETKEQQVQQAKEPWLLSSFQEFFDTKVQRVSAATVSNDEFKLMTIGNTIANEVEVIKHNDIYSFQLVTKDTEVAQAIKSVETDSKLEKIVAIDRGSLNRGIFQLTAKNAGIEKITITVTSETGEVKPLSMIVVVPLEINKPNNQDNQGYYWSVKNEDNAILILDTEENPELKKEGYQVQLKGGENNANATNEFVEWIDDYDHNVIEIDTQKGTIRAIGAGTTKVTLKLLKADNVSKVNKQDKQVTFQVIVAPKGENEEGKEQSKPNLKVTPGEGEDPETNKENAVNLVTNIKSVFKIDWKVDKLTYDIYAKEIVETPIDYLKTDLFTWEEAKGDFIKVGLSNLKAGTYRVRGHLVNLDSFDEDFRKKFGNKTYVEFKIVVYMNFKNEKEISMNTGGDSFSILDSSNLYKEDFEKLISIGWPEGDNIQTDLENSLSINKDKGTVISGTNGGKSIQVEVTYGQTRNNLHIYDQDTLNEMQKELGGRLAWIYKFSITDKISLDHTNIILYTNSTEDLTLVTTNNIEDIIWRFRDKDGNEFETNEFIEIKPAGKNGSWEKITLVPIGNKIPDDTITLVAHQTIGNVQKSAECKITVKQAYDAIKLFIYADEDKKEKEFVESLTITLNKKGDIYKWIGADATPKQEPPSREPSLDWSISDTSVVDFVQQESISDEGRMITVKGYGTAILTAVDTRNNVMASCVITVTEPAKGIEIKGIKDGDKLTLKYVKNGKYPLIAKVIPDGNNQQIKWGSSNGNVAEIDDYGIITFVKPGNTRISASVIAEDKDGTLYPYNLGFDLALEDSPGSVSLNYDNVEMYVGDKPVQLSATVVPANPGNQDVEWNQNVEWISIDESIVDVDETGLLTAKSPGKTQVMVRTEEGGHYALCNVTVKQHAMGVKMSYTQITLNVGEYFDMDVTITPVDATEASLLWESLHTNIVTVSSTGRITGRAAGEGTVMVKTQNGSTSFCTVTVVEPVFSLELDEEEVTIDIEDTFVLEPIFQPANPSNTEVIWSSSDDNVAEVNEFGEVTGISGGSAGITCESVDGGYRAYCLVTVIEPVVEVTMNPETYRLALGKTYTLTATVSNHGTATNAELEWSSSDESVCTVDNKGNIVGVDYGYATITAEATDNSGAFATCEVRVIREVTSIKLNHTVLTMLQGESVSLQVNVQPSNASYVTTKFSSSDESVAIVDEDGVITALNPGSAVIRSEARDNSGKFALCYVTVSAPIVATGITVSDKEVVLTPKEQKQVVISMKPTNSTDTVTWTSNNEAVASVNSKGMITAHTTGKATITVMTTSGKMETVVVTVLGLNRTTLEIPIYTKYSKLVVDGAVGTVRWDVDDSTICEVNNGVIIGRKLGTTKVTATINGRTLTCTVKVVR